MTTDPQEPPELPPLLPPALPSPVVPGPRPRPRWRRWLFAAGGLCLAIVVAAACAAPSLLASWRTRRLGEQLTQHADADQWQAGLALAATELSQVEPDARIYLALERLHYAANHLEETKRFARKTLELEPGNEMAVRVLISVCRDFDDNETAYQAGKDWIARNATGSDVYKDLAMAADDAGHDDEALGYAETAYRRKPGHPRIAGVYFYYAILADGADTVLPRVLRWASRNTPDDFFWAQVGKSLSEVKEFRQALVHLRCALAMGSADATVATEILDCFRGLEDPDGAKEFVESYQQSHPLTAAIWRMLGATQFDAEDYGSALDSFRMAQRLEPDSAITMANLVFTLVDLQRAEDALAEGAAWLATGRAKPTALFERAMGNASFALSRWVEAERHYRAALGIDPALQSAARDLISTLLKLGRTADAVAFGSRWQEENRDAVDDSFTQTLEEAQKQSGAGASPARAEAAPPVEKAG